MRKLNEFNKTNKKRSTIKLIVSFILVAVVSATISYALYQKTDEIQFINAKVGSFDTSNSDIELAMIVDGEEVSTPPEKNDLYTVTIECDYATGRCNKEEWGADIRNIESNRVKCNVNFETPAPTLSAISVTANKTDIILAYLITSTGEINKTCKYGIEENNLTNEGTLTDSGCTLDNLDRGVTYYYEVCVNSPKHEPVCKKGNNTTIPIEIAKPTVSNISASASTNSITLNYSITGENITGYTCKYGTDTNYTRSSSASATSCILSGLEMGIVYYYQICGTNSSGTTCQTGSTRTTLPEGYYTCKKVFGGTSSYISTYDCLDLCHDKNLVYMDAERLSPNSVRCTCGSPKDITEKSSDPSVNVWTCSR